MKKKKKGARNAARGGCKRKSGTKEKEGSACRKERMRKLKKACGSWNSWLSEREEGSPWGSVGRKRYVPKKKLEER